MRYIIHTFNERVITNFYEPTEEEYNEASREFNEVLDKHLANLYKIVKDSDMENLVRELPVKKATGNMNADLGKSRYKIQKGIGFMVNLGDFEVDTRKEYLRVCKSLNAIINKLNDYCKKNSLDKLRFSKIIKDTHQTMDGKPVPTTAEIIRGTYTYIPKKSRKIL